MNNIHQAIKNSRINLITNRNKLAIIIHLMTLLFTIVGMLQEGYPISKIILYNLVYIILCASILLFVLKKVFPIVTMYLSIIAFLFTSVAAIFNVHLYVFIFFILIFISIYESWKPLAVVSFFQFIAFHFILKKSIHFDNPAQIFVLSETYIFVVIILLVITISADKTRKNFIIEKTNQTIAQEKIESLLDDSIKRENQLKDFNKTLNKSLSNTNLITKDITFGTQEINVAMQGQTNNIGKINESLLNIETIIHSLSLSCELPTIEMVGFKGNGILPYLPF